MKKIFIILIVVILVGGLFTFTAFAQSNNYTVLAPLPGINSSTNLTDYVPAMFNLLIGLSAVFAVLMIVIGGFQYMSTDAIQGKSAGKERIKNAIFGLVLVIGAWLILYTINPKLLTLDLSISPASTSAPSGGILSGVATGADLLSGYDLTDDMANRVILTANPSISINNPPCTTSRTSNCTNLNGLPQSMILSIKSLQSACAQSNGGSCPIVITGGTETSLHSAGTQHGPGNSVVDLRPTSELNSYLGITSPKNGDIVTKNGLEFTYETVGSGGISTGDHWHVTA
jgi:hypothetical protein